MSTISAGTTSTTAFVSTADTSGQLVLQTNGTTTAVTVGTNQVVTLAQPLPVTSGGTGATSLSGITVGTATTATTATNLAGGSNGTIPYQSAAGTTQMLAVGTSGQVLQTNGAGAPTWVTVASGSSYTAKTSAYTAVAGDNILADTSSGSFTITLPASPSTGGVINVVDSKGTFQRYPLTIGRNGNTIMGLSEDLIAGTSTAGFGLVYNGTEWRII